VRTFNVFVTANFDVRVEAEDAVEAENQARLLAHGEWRDLPLMGPPSWHFHAVGQDDWGV